MSMRGWWAGAIALYGLTGGPLHEGWNEVRIRGMAQHILRVDSVPGAARAAVLFVPGDAGYRGAAREMARKLAENGRTVYVWDTKRYLESFSKHGGSLSTEDFGRDFRSMRLAIEPDRSARVLLAGWSQGAAMSVAAVAEEAPDPAFQGLLVLALPERGALRWDWVAGWVSLFGGTPAGPEFDTEPFLPMLRGFPVAVIQAGNDRFTARSVSRRFFLRLRHPHRARMLPSARHDFGPDRSELYAMLESDLEWLEQWPGDREVSGCGRK